MVDTIGLANAVAGAPSYSGRALRQLNGVGFAGATSALPLGVRSGVRPGTSTTTVTATSTTWTCGPVAGIADVMVAAESGGYPFSFDGTATGSVTAASGSYGRVDLLYVLITDPENGSTVPTATRMYQAGVAASSPVAPATPAGGLAIANINVPISGGGSPTVTWVAPYAVAAGGILPVATLAALNLITGWLEARAVVFADVISTNNADYRWNGSAWVAALADTGWIAAPLVNGWVSYGGAYMVAQYRRRNGIVHVEGVIKGGGSVAGGVIFNLPVGFRPSAYIQRVAIIPGTATSSIELGPVGNIVQGSTGISSASTGISFTFIAEA
jgi:hypothetical protein